MTITISWERRLRGHSEIVMCSDSRLTGGGNIDVCQKIFPLPREDCAIGFCGSTLIAYPIINQFKSYILGYQKNLSRGLDGSEIPRRFCDLVNEFLRSYINAVDLLKELRETEFVISFFSWKLKKPIVSRIHFEKSKGEYVPTASRFPKRMSAKMNRLGYFSVIGDHRHLFFEELRRLIDFDAGISFDMEPLEALCNMLRDTKYTDRSKELKGFIGGAPQILKVYPYMRTLEFAVRWPDKNGSQRFINGRKVFEWENLTMPHFDPEDGTTYYPLAEMQNNSFQDVD